MGGCVFFSWGGGEGGLGKPDVKKSPDFRSPLYAYNGDNNVMITSRL